jgi:hypothetical protein
MAHRRITGLAAQLAPLEHAPLPVGLPRPSGERGPYLEHLTAHSSSIALVANTQRMKRTNTATPAVPPRIPSPPRIRPPMLATLSRPRLTPLALPVGAAKYVTVTIYRWVTRRGKCCKTGTFDRFEGLSHEATTPTSPSTKRRSPEIDRLVATSDPLLSPAMPRRACRERHGRQRCKSRDRRAHRGAKAV